MTSFRNEEIGLWPIPAVTYSPPLGATERSRPKPAEAGQKRSRLLAVKAGSFPGQRRSRLKPAEAGSFRGAQRIEGAGFFGQKPALSWPKPASFGQRRAGFGRLPPALPCGAQRITEPA